MKKIVILMILSVLAIMIFGVMIVCAEDAQGGPMPAHCQAITNKETCNDYGADICLWNEQTNSCVINSDTDCQNLYWFDNENKECGLKEFCGAYMYYGLQTFESKTQCENALNESTSCEKDGDCGIYAINEDESPYLSCCGLCTINYSSENFASLNKKFVVEKEKSLNCSGTLICPTCERIYYPENEKWISKCIDNKCIKTKTEFGNCAKEGEMCAGIAGIECCGGLTCSGVDEGPDAPGVCVNKNKSCGDYRYSTCPEGCSKRCVPSGCRGDICTADCEGKGSCYSEKNKFCDYDENGKCMFNLSNGRKAEIKIMPDTASAKAIERLGELGFTIELKEVGKETKDTKDDKVVYELTGNKQGKFLGIFKIMARVQAQVDAETGNVKVIKPWWSFLASSI